MTAQSDEEIELDNEDGQGFLTTDDTIDDVMSGLLDDDDGNERSSIADNKEKDVVQDMENLLADPQLILRIRARIIKRLRFGIPRPACQRTRHLSPCSLYRRPTCSSTKIPRPYCSGQQLREGKIQYDDDSMDELMDQFQDPQPGGRRRGGRRGGRGGNGYYSYNRYRY